MNYYSIMCVLHNVLLFYTYIDNIRFLGTYIGNIHVCLYTIYL